MSAIQELIGQAASLPAARKVVPMSPGLIAILRLESIGDNYRAVARGFDSAIRRMRSIPHAHRLRVIDMASPWVARIVGRDKRYKLARQFLRGLRDYREANKSGSRGVHLYYILPHGIYEVHELLSWQKERTYFVRSHGGKLTEITDLEVDAWLSTQSSGPR